MENTQNFMIGLSCSFFFHCFSFETEFCYLLFRIIYFKIISFNVDKSRKILSNFIPDLVQFMVVLSVKQMALQISAGSLNAE